MDILSNITEILTLITGLIGLISAGIGVYFAFKKSITAAKDKSAQENWNLIMEIADAAMVSAEQTGASGVDKKTQVLEAVKAGCTTAGIDINSFIDQLSTYIDQCIAFANKLNKK